MTTCGVATGTGLDVFGAGDAAFRIWAASSASMRASVASAAATSAAVGLCGDSVGAFSIGVDWRFSILRIGDGAATGLGAGVGAF